jgi:hypothetical protein
MVTRVFIIPAYTMAMAKNALRSEIPKDQDVLWHHPDAEKKPRMDTACGRTIAEARRNIESLLPAGVDSYESVQETDAYISKETVTAFPDEVERKVAAAAALMDHDEILDTRLITKGSRGVAGLFKKPDTYEVSIRRRASVRFRTRQKTIFVFVTGNSSEEYYCERCRRINARTRLKRGTEMINREYEREVWRCSICGRVIEAGGADWV